MPAAMSSKERTLAAIRHQEADRVPVFFRGVPPLSHLWKNARERVDVLLAMGVDELVNVELRPSLHPDVTVRDWVGQDSRTGYRLACREYDTPKGTIRTVMRCTEDCRYEEGVPLVCDHNISRGVEFPVKDRDDLAKLAYLLKEPDKKDIALFRDEARSRKRFAAERGVLVCGYAGPGGDLAFWLCGADWLYLAQDDPGFAEELTGMIYDRDTKCLEIVLEAGVDIVLARGCYETAPLWSPQFHEKLFAPGLQKKTTLAHQAGVKLSYFSTGEFTPHADTLVGTGVDAIEAVRPSAAGTNDMRVLKKRIGDRICLWGGVNPEEDIVRSTPGGVRRSVVDVILAAASGGGLILSTGGSIYDEGCYENVMAFIETAREFGRYPIDKARLEQELRDC